MFFALKIKSVHHVFFFKLFEMTVLIVFQELRTISYLYLDGIQNGLSMIQDCYE